MSRNVVLAAAFDAPPERLYDMYLDASAHEAFTGQAVTIAARAGAPFSAFGGALTGSVLHVEPKRLIVQRWRSSNWPAAAIDSVLVLSFWAEGRGARIELVQANVPESDFAGVSQGWERYYWTPWRAFLARESGG